MSEGPGVGINGEPDDFAARYDRMVEHTGGRRMLRAAIVAAVLVLALFVISLLV